MLKRVEPDLYLRHQFLMRLTCDPKLTSTAKAIGGVLLDRIEKGGAHVSYTALARATTRDRSRIKFALVELKPYFVITSGTDCKTANRYVPKWRQDEDSDE
jgi:hypothetical protein